MFWEIIYNSGDYYFLTLYRDMCTIGSLHRKNIFCVFKNRDVYTSPSGNQRFEKMQHKGVWMYVFRDGENKAEGFNEFGVSFWRATLASKNETDDYLPDLDINIDFLTARSAKEVLEKMKKGPQNAGSYVITDPQNIKILEILPGGDWKEKDLTEEAFYATTNHGRLFSGQEGYEAPFLQKGSRERLSDTLLKLQTVEEEVMLKHILTTQNKKGFVVECSEVFNDFTTVSLIYFPQENRICYWLAEASETPYYISLENVF